MTAELDELVPWLREQIAADRDREARVQRRARELYEAWQPSNPYTWDEQANDVRDEYLHAAVLLVDQEMPAVLAQCDSRTTILDECVRVHENHFSDDFTADDLADLVVQQLGVAYQHRPGYREEWRP